MHITVNSNMRTLYSIRQSAGYFASFQTLFPPVYSPQHQYLFSPHGRPPHWPTTLKHVRRLKYSWRALIRPESPRAGSLLPCRLISSSTFDTLCRLRHGCSFQGALRDFFQPMTITSTSARCTRGRRPSTIRITSRSMTRTSTPS